MSAHPAQQRQSLRFAPKAEFDRIRNAPLPIARKIRLFADLARFNTLYMIERAGSGHIGSSFSSLDIVSWLHLSEMDGIDRPGGDIFFSSKGHDAPGLYAAMLGLGMLPFDKLHSLRRLGGLPGHPDISTPAIHTNTGSLGMGISKAKGFVLADRLDRRRRRIFVMTGDGELQEGQIWESLGSAANRKMGEIVAIVDANKFQSDTYVSRVSALGDLAAKFRAFGWACVECDGHDPAALDAAMRALEAFSDQPKAIIADTIKGAGVSFMQHTTLAPDQEFYKFHSGAPGPENYMRAREELEARVNAGLAAVEMGPIAVESVDRVTAAPADGLVRLIPAYGDALLEHARLNPNIVALDGDLMIDCGLLKFRDAFGDRFFECGIAEQDMVSIAGALALSGKLPVVHSFACFLSTRPNEQIFNNGTERSKIVYVGSLAGLVPGGPGHSHQSIRDIGVLGNVPGLVLIEPATPAEVAEALSWCLTQNRASSYLRLISVPWKAPSEPQGPLVFGKGREIRKGGDVVLIGYGPILLGEAENAASQIEQATGHSVGIVNLPWLNAVDAPWLLEATRDAKLVVSLDNHSAIGGQGDQIAAALANSRTHAPLLRLSVEGIAECGTPAEVLAHHGIDAAGIAAAVAKALAAPA